MSHNSKNQHNVRPMMTSTLQRNIKSHPSGLTHFPSGGIARSSTSSPPHPRGWSNGITGGKKSGSVPPLENQKSPVLVAQMEAYLTNELTPLDEGDVTSRLGVFRNCFQMFINHFSLYSGILTKILKEFDTYVAQSLDPSSASAHSRATNGQHKIAQLLEQVAKLTAENEYLKDALNQHRATTPHTTQLTEFLSLATEKQKQKQPILPKPKYAVALPFQEPLYNNLPSVTSSGTTMSEVVAESLKPTSQQQKTIEELNNVMKIILIDLDHKNSQVEQQGRKIAKLEHERLKFDEAMSKSKQKTEEAEAKAEAVKKETEQLMQDKMEVAIKLLSEEHTASMLQREEVIKKEHEEELLSLNLESRQNLEIECAAAVQKAESRWKQHALEEKHRQKDLERKRFLAQRQITAPIGTVTMVFTDIQGSTTLWEKCTDAMARSLVLHNVLIRKEIKANSGYEVKTQGDSFMVAFQRTVDAMQFAIDIQLKLLDENWPEEIQHNEHAATSYTMMVSDDMITTSEILLWRGVRVRMGMHVGKPHCEVDPTSGRMDYLGPMINKAARVESSAIGGCVHLSDEAYNAIKHDKDLISQIVAQPAGTIKLKGIAAPQHIWAVMPKQLAPRIGASTSSALQEEEEDSTIDPPTGRVAVLFLAVHQNEKIETLEPEAYLASIRLYRRCVAKIVTTHGGYISNSDGDKFQIVYQTPPMALLACVHTQQALMNLSWPQKLETISYTASKSYDGEPVFNGLRIKMGINMVDAKPIHNLFTGKMAYTGEAVSLAATFASIARAGEVLVSEEVFKACTDIDTHEVWIERASIVKVNKTKQQYQTYRAFATPLMGRIAVYQDIDEEAKETRRAQKKQEQQCLDWGASMLRLKTASRVETMVDVHLMLTTRTVAELCKLHFHKSALGKEIVRQHEAEEETKNKEKEKRSPRVELAEPQNESFSTRPKSDSMNAKEKKKAEIEGDEASKSSHGPPGIMKPDECLMTPSTVTFVDQYQAVEVKMKRYREHLRQFEVSRMMLEDNSLDPTEIAAPPEFAFTLEELVRLDTKPNLHELGGPATCRSEISSGRNTRRSDEGKTTLLLSLHSAMRVYFSLMKAYLMQFDDDTSPIVTDDDFVRRWIGQYRTMQERCEEIEKPTKKKKRKKIKEIYAEVCDIDLDEKEEMAMLHHPNFLRKAILGMSGRHFQWVKTFIRGIMRKHKMKDEGNAGNKTGRKHNRPLNIATNVGSIQDDSQGASPGGNAIKTNNTIISRNKPGTTSSPRHPNEPNGGEGEKKRERLTFSDGISPDGSPIHSPSLLTNAHDFSPNRAVKSNSFHGRTGSSPRGTGATPRAAKSFTLLD